MIGCRPLENDEVEHVIDAMQARPTCLRDQALFVIGITTGFRISEILSLRIRDVTTCADLNSHIRIPASRMKGKKRARSALIAPFARPYIQALLDELRLLNRNGGNQWLFQSRKGQGAIHRVQAHRLLTAAFRHAEIFGPTGELGTHCMRKTFASKMWDAHDGNIWKVQNAMGHASPASTVAYLSFNEDEQRSAVEYAFAAR